MRSKNPELMKQISEFIESYEKQHRRAPSLSVIGKEIGIAKSTVYKYLIEMDEKGMIDYSGNELRSKISEKIDAGYSSVALIGSVRCGTPEYAEENIEGYYSLPDSIFGSGDMFILRAAGDSMIEAGIDNGDLVVCRKESSPSEGDIVVALVDGESTLKRLVYDRKHHMIRLHAENREYDDICINEGETLIIQGIATKVIKDLEGSGFLRI